MALVFPTPAQAALQTPVNTFSPTSSPLANTANTSTYTYDTVRGVWLTSTPGPSTNAMPCSGGTFTGPVNFDCPSLFCGVASFCCNTAFACTATFDDIVVCGTALHCGDTITCGDHYIYGTTYNCGNVVNTGTVTNCALVINCADTCTYGTAYHIGNTVTCGTALFCENTEICGNTVTHGTALFCGNVINEGTVTNCALVENCADVCNYGTTYNIGNTVHCGNSLFCGNMDVCGTTTNHGDIYNCGTTYNVGNTVTCGTALFCGNMETCGTVLNNGAVTNCGTVTNEGPVVNCGATTFCGTTTFCSTPVLPPGTPLGCALDITYDNVTSGLTATNVQAAIDEVAGSSAAAIPCACLTAIGSILTSDGSDLTALPVGADGQILVADSGETLGMKWVPQSPSGVQSISALAPATVDNTDPANPVIGADAVPNATYTALGDLVIGSGAGTYTTLTVGSDGQILVADSAAPDGVKWITQAPSGVVGVTGTAPITVDNTDAANPVVGIDAASTTQAGAVRLNDTVTSTSTTEAATANIVKTVYDLAAAAVPNSTFTALGEVIVGTGAGSYVVLAPTADGQVLTADSGSASGLSWVTPVAGTVTSITAGVGLDGGTITTSGTIDLADTAVTPGSYTYSSFTVDQQGRITAASNGATPVLPADFTAKGDLLVGDAAGSFTALNVSVTDGYGLVADSGEATGVKWAALCQGTLTGVTINAPLTVDNTNPAIPDLDISVATTVDVGVVSVGTNIAVDAAGEISVADASTTGKGVVQLYDALNSTSITEALTAAKGKDLQDQINALANAGGLTLAGTYDGATSQMITVTTAGAAASFTVGADLPAASAGNADYFVIVTVAGGGATNGDWYLSSGSAWDLLDVGFQAPAASTTQQGVVELADNAETQTGTDATRAVTPASLQSKLSDSVATTSSSTIASSTAVKTAYDLAAAAIPCAAITAKGDLITGTAAGTPTALGVGADGQVLAADSGVTEGLAWITPCSGTVTNVATGTGLTGGPITTTGTIALADTAVTPGTYSFSCITVDQQGRLTAASSGPTPVLGSCFNAKGDILVGCTNDVYCTLTVGANGQVLVADSNCTYGVTWRAVSSPGATPTSLGAVFGCVTNNSNGNAFVGYCAGAGSATSVTTQNVALGVCALLTAGTSACGNTAIGFCSAPDVTTGCCNTILGSRAGANITTGCYNVILGAGVTPGANTTRCLLIGFCLGGSGVNWIEGTPIGHIKPAAGILDRTNSLGTAGQVLSSTGSGLEWITPGGGSVSDATPNTVGGVYGKTTDASGFSAFFGVKTGESFTAESCNTLIGAKSFINATTSQCNTAVGLFTGVNATSATENALFGHVSGGALTTGCYNTFLGTSSGINIDTGCYNVMVGYGVGTTVTNTTCCLLIGNHVAGTDYNWITGDNAYNVCFPGSITPAQGIFDCTAALGTAGQVLSSTGAGGVEWITPGGGSVADATPNTVGGVYGCTVNNYNANALLGFEAGCALTGDFQNVGMGPAALVSATTALNNTAIGARAACALTTGCDNVVMGSRSGLNVTTGECNTFVGYCSGSLITTECGNVAIGYNMSTPGGADCQLAIGVNGVQWLCGNSAFQVCFPGEVTFASGILDCDGLLGSAGQVLSSTATGVKWVAAGGGSGGAPATPTTCGAVYGRTTEDLGNGGAPAWTTLLGYQAGACSCAADTTSTNSSTAIGAFALFSNQYTYGNIAMGPYAMYSHGSTTSGGIRNVAIGEEAMYFGESGQCNVAIGYRAARGNAGNWSHNVVIGPATGSCMKGGCNVLMGWNTGVLGLGINNVGIGANVLCSGTTGICNTAVGTCALRTGGGACLNTAIGFCAGGNISTGTNNTAIGAFAVASSSSASNEIVLGNSSITVIRAAVQTISTLSDARDKTDVTALPIGLDFVNALNPVKFTWQQREANEVKDGTSEAGFIAQELRAVEDQFGVTDYLGLVYDENPEKLEASPGKLIPVLVKAIQELSAEVTALRAEVQELKK